MKRFFQFLSYVLVAALASCVTLFIVLGTNVSQPDKLDEVRQRIDRYFIGEPDWAAVEDAAAQAMIDELGDRWSYYVNASDYQALKEQKNNAYVGVGITVSVREDETGFDVLSVTKGGPAQEAGILAGDLLTHAQGQSAVELGLSAARELIRGEAGTFVELTVIRDGQTMNFTVERRNILTPVVTSTMLDGNIGLIQIVNFNSRSAADTVSGIEELLDQGAKALIFDVRNNPGGYKNEMVTLLDYLLPEGPLFRSENYTGATAVDESDANFLDIPMAVLVNGDSYSAAELFAAALSEYDAAVVVGERTTGKGHFQVTCELSDGSAVNLSIGRYTTPNGVNLDGVGITPDVEVSVTAAQAAQIYAGTLLPNEDPQILAAVEALNNP